MKVVFITNLKTLIVDKSYNWSFNVKVKKFKIFNKVKVKVILFKKS